MTRTGAAISTVSVVGLGYIGLPTASVLAAHGLEVVGVDVNSRVVELINSGKAHIVEPDLNAAVHGAVALGNLRAVTSPEPADVHIVAVPTPFREEKKPDLVFVESAVRSIAPVLRPDDLVIIESTCPPGTTRLVASWLAEERPELPVAPLAPGVRGVRLAYCPERVLPGRVLVELVTNDRVIGGVDPESARAAEQLYKVFVQGDCLLTDALTAELVKLAENAYRDVNIAFANELAAICSHEGASPWEVIALANYHPRVNILQPGPGVGGHCISVDPWFLVDAAPSLSRLIRTAREVNDAVPGTVVARVDAAHAGVGGPIACLGLSFKANIDDLRESPSVEVVRLLAGREMGELLVVEPHVDELPESLQQPGISLVSLSVALERANVVVVLVDHDAFRTIDRDLLAEKVVVDTRGVFA